MHPRVLLYLSNRTNSCHAYISLIQSLYLLQEKYFQLFNALHSQNIDLIAILVAHSQKQQEAKQKHETYMVGQIRDNIHTHFTHPTKHTHTLHTPHNKLFQLNHIRQLVLDGRQPNTPLGSTNPLGILKKKPNFTNNPNA